MEVRDDVPGAVPVRGSKVADGPVLSVSASAWSAFVELLAPSASAEGHPWWRFLSVGPACDWVRVRRGLLAGRRRFNPRPPPAAPPRRP
ncbi:DUF397 domain-containing protein [Streptomyces sedi]|uniref:DUF397 domain-containing protein n=1 Tax=Streptomyces sedi TaxID=555059 RepID=A0A5C4VDE7_9ACTN|nr:DUF397 domain-containing protein [Streptomyces sedi]TNM33426.1 DUF397 domain-containing protein [Streptomyces sedi]